MRVVPFTTYPGYQGFARFSPDGNQIVFSWNGEKEDNWGIYVKMIGTEKPLRLTTDPGEDRYPVWSPDGSRIAFSSNRDGAFNLYQKASNLGTEDVLLFKSSDNKLPSSWSPDGRFLLYYSPIPPVHIWLLPLGGEADRKPVRLDNSEFNEAYGRVSPDGRWIAYHSDESGRNEIYVRPADVALLTGSSSAGVPPVTGKWMVSKGGGTTALWRRDGKELFYLGLDGSAMAVEVSSGESFQAGIPKVLFKVPQGVLFWDVSADGKRFLMAAPSAASANTESKFTVVLNWPSLLKK
jgi:Tol biopolymer transport system component